MQQKWCLGGRALPLLHWKASKVDLHEVTGEADVDEAPLLLLNFKATADMEWLSEHLRLASRWWLLNSRKVPLLQELLKQIEKKNIKAKRAASTCKLVVGILLRDKVVLVLNDARAPILAFDANEPNFAALEWFVKELASDIQEMESGATRHPPSSDTTPSSSCHEGEELAKDVVAKLKRHPLCQNAWFLPSRGSFKILRTDKKYFEVGIPDVQKLQKKAKVDSGDLAWQPFETTVIQTYAKALGVLNAETNMALEPFLGGVLNAETNKALETKNPEFGIDLGTKKREETMPRPSQRQRLLTESWVGSS